MITTNLYPSIFPKLNLAEMDVVEGAAGPGRRLVIWLQGCLKRCPGCANGPFLSESTGRLFSIAELCDVMDRCGAIEGLTLSGGEPVLQAEALLPLLKEAHDRNLNVVCYSGYELEELTTASGNTPLEQFLAEVDLLIDGEYHQELPAAGDYRPSANQRLHFLSERISPESCRQTTQTEFHITGNRVTATGTLPIAIRKLIAEKLRDHGVILDSVVPQKPRDT